MNLVKGGVYLILALGCATATVLLAGQAGSRQADPREPAPALESFVAAKSRVAAGERLGPDRLKLVRLPAAVAPAGSFHAMTDLHDRVAAMDILPGDVITQARLAPPGSPAGIAALLEPGTRAMTVRIGDHASAPTMPGAGSYVDVIVTRRTGAGQGAPVARTALRRVRVLATDGGADLESRLRSGGARTVTLMVRPEEAQLLAQAGTEGIIHLSLRTSDHEDQDVASKEPEPVEPPPPPVEPTPVDEPKAPPQHDKEADRMALHQVTIIRGLRIEQVEFERPERPDSRSDWKVRPRDALTAATTDGPAAAGKKARAEAPTTARLDAGSKSPSEKTVTSAGTRPIVLFP